MSPRRLTAWALCSLFLCVSSITAARCSEPAAPLPGTKPLTINQPLDEVMVSGINRFALSEIEKSVERRAAKWKRDYSSSEAYLQSTSANRKRLHTIVGAVDPRIEGTGIELLATLSDDWLIAETEAYRVMGVRWQVLDGVTAEGLILQPNDDPAARVVALPDADWTPEMFAGLVEGVPPQAQLACRLAENGVQVLIPMLISRDDTFSGSDYVAYTNQPHREYVYRMAFEMGRHVIGYEVQKVLAAVDRFAELNKKQEVDLPIGVAGVGEGGLLALFSAACDPRIDAAMVCGYFQQREGVWEEPIYRNVWAQLAEFGDAELAGLIAPRPLVIEACGVPEVAGPPEPKQGRRGGAAPGKIETATLASVRLEYDRAKVDYDRLDAADALTFVASGEGDQPAGTAEALTAFVNALGIDKLKPSGQPAEFEQELPDPTARQKRQLDELVAFTQNLLRLSEIERDKLWAKADRKSLETWEKSAEEYRKLVYDEMIGRLPKSTMPLNPRTRKVLDDPAFTGYEVVLDVYPDVIAAGILLLPKNMKPDEKRPVIVCQHGLEGIPMHTINGPGGEGHQYYKAFAAELARRGFITYAPQNPYRGRDNFRTIQRKSNPLKRSLFSYIIPQHERTLEWLSSLPNVDPDRIGFYGLSYGGKTAVRVPPLVKQYALSICSADYNEWVKKNTNNLYRYSYIFTGEYEIFEWNMGHTANYAELSYLMTPRPFMVERGHDDGVAPDEWVAYEYAKVRRHYVKLGIGERTEIEFFNGPHSINGEGTYDFLHRHLNWPTKVTATTSSGG